MQTDTAWMTSASAFGGEDGVRSEDIRAKIEVDGERMGSGGLRVLDRRKFLVD